MENMASTFSPMNTNHTMNTTDVTNTNTQSKQFSSNHHSQAMVVLQVTLLATLGIIIMIGNLASIVTFLKTQSLRRRCHYLIISLSFADFFVGVDVFMVMYFFLMNMKVEQLFKVLLEFFDTFFGSTSISTLAVIALERFYAIYFPFRHMMLEFKYYVVGTVVPWVISLVIASMYLIAHFGKNYNAKQVYFYNLFIGPFIALLAVVILYICIWLKLRRDNPNAQDRNRTLREHKLAITLLIVTVASLVTWFPLHYLLIISYFCPSCTVPNASLLLFVMSFLRFCNSAINVFIYVVRIPEFRKAFLALLIKREQVEAPRSTEHNSHLPRYPHPSTAMSGSNKDENGNQSSPNQRNLLKDIDTQRSEAKTRKLGRPNPDKGYGHQLKYQSKLANANLRKEGMLPIDNATSTENTEPGNIDLNDYNDGVANVGFSGIEDTKL